LSHKNYRKYIHEATNKLQQLHVTDCKMLGEMTAQSHCLLCRSKQHLFNGPLSGTTQVSQYQKVKTNLDLLEQEILIGSGISWAVCRSAPCRRQPRQHPPLQNELQKII